MAGVVESRPKVLAVTERVDARPENGSQLIAGALLERLAEWFDFHVLLPGDATRDESVLRLPADFDENCATLPELPDVSLVYNLGATSFACRASAWAARLLSGVPLVNHFQINLGCYARHQDVEAGEAHALAAQQARAASQARRNLFCSHSELRLADESFPRGLADAYVVANPFVPAGDPAPERESKTFTFFAAGRFTDRVKGADLLFRAFRELIDGGASARLEIASDGERFTSALNGLPRGTWRQHGWLSREALHSRLAGADVVVVPSRYEPFGLVAIEAMAMGTPVIATEVGGLQELVHHGVTGWLSPATDGSRGLRDAMACALAAGSETSASMGRVAAGFIRREFSLERVAGAVRVHLDNALVRGTASHPGTQPVWNAP